MGLDAGDCSWAVVGTDAGELGNPVEDRNLSRPLRLHHAPSVAIAAVAGLENNGRRAGPLAREVEPAAADVDQAGEVAARRRCEGGRLCGPAHQRTMG